MTSKNKSSNASGLPSKIKKDYLMTLLRMTINFWEKCSKTGMNMDIIFIHLLWSTMLRSGASWAHSTFLKPSVLASKTCQRNAVLGSKRRTLELLTWMRSSKRRESRDLVSSGSSLVLSDSILFLSSFTRKDLIKRSKARWKSKYLRLFLNTLPSVRFQSWTKKRVRTALINSEHQL